MQRVGFVGLGAMGEPMAANLLKAGFGLNVVGHRNPDPVARLVAGGALRAASVAEAAARSDVLVLSLPDDAVVEQVLTGTDGVVSGAHDGLVVVDASTISPLTARKMASVLSPLGVVYLDAPVSGGQGGAIAGTLAIMVGGSREAFDEVQPVLSAMGKAITYVGPSGSALVVKLGNNLIVAAQAVAIAEALTLAKAAGVDTGLVHKILSASTSRSWILQEKVAQSVLRGDLRPGFRLSLMRKDLGLAVSFAQYQHTPVFATALLHQLYTLAQDSGKGDLDAIGICELYTDATRTDLRAD